MLWIWWKLRYLYAFSSLSTVFKMYCFPSPHSSAVSRARKAWIVFFPNEPYLTESINAPPWAVKAAVSPHTNLLFQFRFGPNSEEFHFCDTIWNILPTSSPGISQPRDGSTPPVCPDVRPSEKVNIRRKYALKSFFVESYGFRSKRFVSANSIWSMLDIIIAVFTTLWLSNFRQEIPVRRSLLQKRLLYNVAATA